MCCVRRRSNICIFCWSSHQRQQQQWHPFLTCSLQITPLCPVPSVQPPPSNKPPTHRQQAHVAPITHVDEVKAVVSVLLESNKIRNATHNIMAYRIADPDRPGVFHQDCELAVNLNAVLCRAVMCYAVLCYAMPAFAPDTCTEAHARVPLVFVTACACNAATIITIP